MQESWKKLSLEVGDSLKKPSSFEWKETWKTLPLNRRKLCTGFYKGILQLCPPDSEVIGGVGGCANKTTKTTIFPVGSRCISNPCQDNGLCFDFPSADGYHCQCYYPYTGLNCQTKYQECLRFPCGNTTSEIIPMCYDFTSGKALPYICICLMVNPPVHLTFALNNCYNEKLFSLECAGAERVGAVPFTNKGFYICLSGERRAKVTLCDSHHVWNDIQKECVPEYTPL